MGLLISYFHVIIDRIFKPRKVKSFEIEDGITLFDFHQSPCARRVRIALLEKNIPFKKIEVDLVKGENHHPDFVKFCPNRKVPALAFKNVEGVPDQVMFESSVIIEYLDSVYPQNKLYPENSWERAQAKMWMDWELGLVDDHVPIAYQTTQAFLLRLVYPTKQVFLSSMHSNMPLARKETLAKVYDGTFKTASELEKHAISAYQSLLVLEKSLEGKEFLVGDKFSVADLTVFPRIRMFFISGLTFTETHFPNIFRYFKKLNNRPSFVLSETLLTRLSRQLMIYAPWVLVTLSNWRCGKKHLRLDGKKYLDKAIGESSPSVTPLVESKRPYVSESDVLVFDYPASSDVCMMKILLKEKGVKFKTIDSKFIDLIGRGSGSGSVLKLQHGGRMVKGPRTVLEYIDGTFQGQYFIPSDPVQKSKVQCWQAWEQAMYANELAPLVETFLMSKVLVLRYEKWLHELLALRSNPSYHAKFEVILKCFMAGLKDDSQCWPKLMTDYSHLKETKEERRRKLELGIQLLHIRLQYLEDSLQDRDFLVGDSLTLADICVFCRLALFAHIGMKISAAKYPKVALWLFRLQGREPFAECIEFLNVIFKI